MFLVWILSLVAFAHGFDSTVLWKVPAPMKSFHIHGYLGNWYIQYRNAPCSWSGSAEFTDYQTSLMMEGDKSVLVRETSRNDLCNTINSRLIMTDTPGVMTIKDPMGNNWSGKYIVVYTDYKMISFTYGCTKMSATGDKCDDGWLSIKTRMVNPGPAIIAKINKVLQEHFGTTVDQLQKVTHKHSCFAPQAAYGTGYNHGHGGHGYAGFGGPQPSAHDDEPVVVVQSAPVPAPPAPAPPAPAHGHAYAHSAPALPSPAHGPAYAPAGHHGGYHGGYHGKKYRNY